MSLKIAIITESPPPDLSPLYEFGRPNDSVRVQNICQNNTSENVGLEILKALMASPEVIFLDRFNDSKATQESIRKALSTGCKVEYLQRG